MRVHRNCCGIDIDKKGIAACVITETNDGAETRHKRLFGTVTGNYASWHSGCVNVG